MAAKKKQKQPLRKLGELIDDIPVAMLTTVVRGAALRSRPMATQQREFDGDLWFFTDKDAAKVAEIGGDKHVNVSFADADANTYVSISGTASLVTDRNRARGLWNPAVQAWFPKGPTDPRLALIRVTVTQAEYWDAPSSRMVRLYEYARAIVRGKRPQNLGENKKLTLKTSSSPRRRRAPAGRR